MQVAPPDLDFHIREAVNIARAHRNVPGVDLPWEVDSLSTLDALRGNDVRAARRQMGARAWGLLPPEGGPLRLHARAILRHPAWPQLPCRVSSTCRSLVFKGPRAHMRTGERTCPTHVLYTR